MKQQVLILLCIVVLCINDRVVVGAGLPDTVGIVSGSAFTPPANQPGRSAYVLVKHSRQELNLCVPTSAAMVLQRHGISKSPRELKLMAEGKKFDPTAEFKDFTPTLFPKIITAVSTLGFAWRDQAYPNTR